MKTVLIITAVIAAFFLGYFLRPVFSGEKVKEENKEEAASENKNKSEKGKSSVVQPETGITGLGGVFFRSKNVKELKNWYNEKLGMKIDGYGVGFEWREGFDGSLYGFTQWSPFNEKTKYFDPSKKEFMINYRVHNLDEFIVTLKSKGVLPVDSIERTDYGNFIHYMDPEGNKLEFWQPSEAKYDSILELKAK
jgi:catechol 2,3-dioxygenase-like lactoylglutathione lyase family enzyme